MCSFALVVRIRLNSSHFYQPETKDPFLQKQRASASLKVRVPYSTSRWRIRKGKVIGHDVLLAVPTFGC